MKLIFLFSFLCLSSIAIGVFVKEKMKNISFSKLHAMPLGFFIILGSYQVIAWPFMLFHLSTTLLAIITMMWLFVLMVMIIRNGLRVKDYIQNCMVQKDNWIIMFIFLALTVSYSLMRSLDTYWDFNFYIPLIGTNVESEFLNTVDPWSGQSGNLNWMYNYQGYYVLMAMLAKTFNIDSTLVMIWIPSLISFGILPCLIVDAINLFFPRIQLMNRMLLLIIIFCLSAFNLNFIEFAYYGANYRILIFGYLLLTIVSYLKKPTPCLGILSVLFMLAHISTHSSALFISIMLLSILFIYLIWFKKVQLIDYALLLSIPIVFYVASVLYDWIGNFSFIVLVGGMAVLLMIYQINKKQPKWWINLLKMMTLIIGGAIYIISVIMIIFHISAPIRLTDFYQSFIQIYYNGFSIKGIDLIEILCSLSILLLLGLGLKNKDEDEFVYFLPIMAVILFFNPIVSPLISSILTGIVYDRTVILIISTVTITLAMKQLLNLKIGKYGLLFITLLAIIIFLNDVSFNSVKKIHTVQSAKTYDLIYKQPLDLLELDQFLNDYTSDKSPEETRIVSIDFRIRLQSRNYLLLYTVADYRLLDEEVPLDSLNLANLYQMIVGSNEVIDEHELQEVLLNHKVNLLIISNPISETLEKAITPYSHLIFENKSYQVYEIKISQ